MVKMLTIDDPFSKYFKESSSIEKINWWDLPLNVKLGLIKLPQDIKKLGNFTSIRRLTLSRYPDKITQNIFSIKKEMTGDKKIAVNFPISLKNNEYAKLYALMVSEGSYKTEFGVNVPEKEFHDLFRESLLKLISEECCKQIKSDFNNNVQRSRAPAIVRYLIPVPKIIPKVILEDRELSRDYLRVVFEAEGSPIFDNNHKRYIKLTRYRNITPFVSCELQESKRIFSGTIKKDYPSLWEKIKIFPPETLLGEHLLLKEHFDIDSKLVLEAIRKNITDLRAGKVTARWVLLIYAKNINRFIERINFMSDKKRDICKLMLRLRANNPQYSTLRIIKEIAKNNYFKRKDFIQKMKEVGYKTPGAFLWRYEKKKLIRRKEKGIYQLLFN